MPKLMATLHKKRLITVCCFTIHCNDNTKCINTKCINAFAIHVDVDVFAIHVDVICSFHKSTTQVLQQNVCSSCC